MEKKTPLVELVYERSCPNIAAAREQLLRAFNEARLVPQWSEWETTQPETPPRVRGLGSPTIMVNGVDVAAETGNEAACCRVYADSDAANKGVPPLANIVAALSAAAGAGRRGHGGRTSLAALPSIGLALLPKLTCPACWPAYAGLLSSLGLGFIDYSPYLLPLTGLFLLITLAGLITAKRRRKVPVQCVVLGIAASILVVLGKFWLNSETVLGVGIALLAGASVWASWPRSRRSNGLAGCPTCSPLADAGRAADD